LKVRFPAVIPRLSPGYSCMVLVDLIIHKLCDNHSSSINYSHTIIIQKSQITDISTFKPFSAPRSSAIITLPFAPGHP